jgi:hypothetical protein
MPKRFSDNLEGGLFYIELDPVGREYIRRRGKEDPVDRESSFAVRIIFRACSYLYESSLYR